ncbi:hypothetical protein LIT54_04915 [Flavobacterium psychrophilum]|uniref:hypothetical protein n=1 Tax=Flavobacterium psychrophilum TaxID=96345 RepID=UPI001D06DE5B|nr:hypothetical protein [Flavobacterium psychrophilum]MCB5985944.1 hypothetical protein [Flavobacterium psychrophilum]
MDNKDNKNLILEAFKNNPKLFLNLIVEFYPINDRIYEILTKIKYDFIFCNLSKNLKIAWNIENIELFKKHIDWADLCVNPSMDWNLRLIEKYKSEIYWYSTRWV